MKKLLALTLAALMVFGMVACASNTDSNSNDTAAPADSHGTGRHFRGSGHLC